MEDYLSLLEIPPGRPNRFRLMFLARLKILSSWFSNKFAFFVGLSLLGHLFLLLILSGVISTGENLSPVLPLTEEKMFSRLAAEAASKLDIQDRTEEEVTAEKIAVLLRKIYERLTFSPWFTEKEKSEILRRFLQVDYSTEDIHVPEVTSNADLDRLIEARLQAGGLKLSSGKSVEVFRPLSGDKYEIYKVYQEKSGMLERRKVSQVSKTLKVISDGRIVVAPTDYGPKELPAGYYFRASPYKKMAAQGGYLFSVIRQQSIQPQFASHEKKAKVVTGTEFARPNIPGSDGFLTVFLSSGIHQAIILPEKKPALILGEAGRKRILDELMPLSIEQQLSFFKKEYLDRYDWNSDELARLTREFLFNNMNSVFFVLDDLSAAFDQLEELYYKRPVYDFFSGCASQLPGSRVNTEARFYLASTLNFEQRTLTKLLNCQADAGKVINGQKKPASIFQPQSKAMTIKQIYLDYLRLSGKLKISVDRVENWYIRQQEKIYADLANCGGEIRNRTLYAWGKLLWQQGQVEQAVEKWKEVNLAEPISSREFWKIRGIIDSYRLSENVRKAIDEALIREAVLDRASLLDRHLKYNTWENRSQKEIG